MLLIAAVGKEGFSPFAAACKRQQQHKKDGALAEGWGKGESYTFAPVRTRHFHMTQSRQMTPRAQLALIAIMVMLRRGVQGGRENEKEWPERGTW